jgi:hypothetical protein
LLQQCLPGLSLQRRKAEQTFLISFNNELNAPVAKVANAIE